MRRQAVWRRGQRERAPSPSLRGGLACRSWPAPARAVPWPLCLTGRRGGGAARSPAALQVNTSYVPEMEKHGLHFVGHDDDAKRMEILEMERMARSRAFGVAGRGPGLTVGLCACGRMALVPTSEQARVLPRNPVPPRVQDAASEAVARVCGPHAGGERATRGLPRRHGPRRCGPLRTPSSSWPRDRTCVATRREYGVGAPPHRPRSAPPTRSPADRVTNRTAVYK